MAASFRSGDVVAARITKIDDRGLVLAADHAMVRVRRDELSLERHLNVAATYRVGDELRVYVKKWVPAATAFAGSIRRTLPGWQEAMAELRHRQVVSATVEQIWASKVRVDLGPVSGRVLREELSLERGLAPSQIVAVGDQIEIAITKWFEDVPWVVGSRRQVLPDWPDVVAQIPVDRVYPACVEYAGAESARVDLGPVSAEVSRAELPGGPEVDPRVELRSGQSVRVLLTHRSPDLQATTGYRASIAGAIARWVEETADISVGELRQATVVAIRDDAIDVDLGSGVSGDIPKHELALEDMEHPQDLFSIGDLVDVVVLWKSPETQTLGLSIRERLIKTNIAQIVGLPESETLEFKEVLFGKFKPADHNAISRKILRTIAAFLNTQGGLIIVGVKDKSREVVGLEDDHGLGAQDIAERIREADESLQRLLSLRLRCGMRPVDLVTWEVLEFRGKHVMTIRCEPPTDAAWNGAWVREGSKKGKVYYVREGETTKELDPDDAAAHVRERAVNAAREEREQ